MLAMLAPDRIVCDRYRILGLLGKGGMGIVFKAEDTALRRLVALKLVTIRNALVDDDDESPLREERFLREASLTAQLAHPNVVTIYDYGRGEEGVESFCYIAMELLTGETLGQRLTRTKGLAVAELLSIATQIGRGLRAAHQRGLVHRDLKPDNIMLTPSEDGEEVVRILDFGLAKDMTATSKRSLTDAGTVMGTPEYMAPEQVEGWTVDARADLYAFGVVLYECIAGTPPFQGNNPFQVATAHVRQAAPPLVAAAGRPQPSLALQNLVRKLLEKRPDRRVQSADELLRLLRELPEAKSARAAEPSEALTLPTAGRYQTGRKLSETARAVVYEATHLELGRQIAVKVFQPMHPAQVARLQRDLPTLALLRHPANTRVLDVGTVTVKSQNRPFLVMDRVRGPTLRALLTQRGTLPWQRAVDLMTAVLDGLAEAHAIGLSHRHLTPEHILVPGADTRHEHPKLIGYRIPDAQVEGSEPRLGPTPAAGYLSPEVMHGAPLNERSDLYAAGAILHEIVLGQLPGSWPGRPVSKALVASPPQPIPHELADILRRTVSLDPADRFDSPTDLVAALSALRRPPTQSMLPRRDSTSERLSQTQQRLRSTGRPIVWVFTGDPALRRQPLIEVLARLRDAARVEELDADRRASLATRIHDGDELSPWVVLFGGMHVILEDPLLAALSQTPEVSRLLVSTHANADLLETAVNFCGLDGHVTLPVSAESLRATIDRMIARTGTARRYYDDLRLVAQRVTPVPGEASELSMVTCP